MDDKAKQQLLDDVKAKAFKAEMMHFKVNYAEACGKTADKNAALRAKIEWREAAMKAREGGHELYEVANRAAAGRREAREKIAEEMDFVLPDSIRTKPVGWDSKEYRRDEEKEFLRDAMFNLGWRVNKMIYAQTFEELVEKNPEKAVKFWEAEANGWKKELSDLPCLEICREVKEDYKTLFEDHKRYFQMAYLFVKNDLPDEGKNIGWEENAPSLRKMREFMDALKNVSADDLIKTKPSFSKQMEYIKMKNEHEGDWYLKAMRPDHTHIVYDILAISRRKKEEELHKAWETKKPKINFQISRPKSNDRDMSR